MRKKRTKRSAEITVETDEILLLKGTQGPRLSYCPRCGRKVSMITPEHAAQIAEVSVRTIYAWVELGKIHFAETTDRSLVICFDSLGAATGRRTAFQVGRGES